MSRVDEEVERLTKERDDERVRKASCCDAMEQQRDRLADALDAVIVAYGWGEPGMSSDPGPSLKQTIEAARKVRDEVKP